MPGGEPLWLDVADPGNGVDFDDKLAADAAFPVSAFLCCGYFPLFQSRLAGSHGFHTADPNLNGVLVLYKLEIYLMPKQILEWDTKP